MKIKIIRNRNVYKIGKKKQKYKKYTKVITAYFAYEEANEIV